jgi:trehalose-phosphatase
MSDRNGPSEPSARARLEPSEAVRRIVERRAATGRLLLGLDFDGTLSPIVPVPEDADILPDAARAIRALAARPDTIIAIVSGRGLDDVRARVREERAFFAGNHGFEIEGPGLRHRLDEAERLRPALRMAGERLRQELEHVGGSEVEDKGITVSVHYRRVEDPAEAERVREIAHREARRSGLRVTEGKKIVELRPPLDWDKGRAVDFLIDTFGRDEPVFPVFIGDDVTDEDAFRAVQARGGLAILVADPHDDRSTLADARVDSPQLLVPLLDALAGGDAPGRGLQG